MEDHDKKGLSIHVQSTSNDRDPNSKTGPARGIQQAINNRERQYNEILGQTTKGEQYQQLPQHDLDEECIPRQYNCTTDFGQAANPADAFISQVNYVLHAEELDTYAQKTVNANLADTIHDTLENGGFDYLSPNDLQRVKDAYSQVIDDPGKFGLKDAGWFTTDFEPQYKGIEETGHNQTIKFEPS